MFFSEEFEVFVCEEAPSEPEVCMSPGMTLLLGQRGCQIGSRSRFWKRLTSRLCCDQWCDQNSPQEVQYLGSDGLLSALSRQRFV